MKNRQSPLIPNGYYIKPRIFPNSPIAQAPPHIREIWDYFLREANHSDYISPSLIIQRGQLFRTYKQIQDALSWRIGFRVEIYSKNQIHSAFKYLKKHKMITATRTPVRATAKTTTRATKGVLITVINYDTYQDAKSYESHSESHNDTHTESHTINKNELNNNKNKNELNNQKRRATTVPSSPPTLETIQALNRFGFNKSFVKSVLEKWSDEEIRNAIMVLRQAKSPENPEAFFHQALIKGWKPKNGSKIKNKTLGISEHQEEALDDTEAFISHLSPKERQEFLDESEIN